MDLVTMSTRILGGFSGIARPSKKNLPLHVISRRKWLETEKNDHQTMSLKIQLRNMLTVLVSLLGKILLVASRKIFIMASKDLVLTRMGVSLQLHFYFLALLASTGTVAFLYGRCNCALRYIYEMRNSPSLTDLFLWLWKIAIIKRSSL